MKWTKITVVNDFLWEKIANSISSIFFNIVQIFLIFNFNYLQNELFTKYFVIYSIVEFQSDFHPKSPKNNIIRLKLVCFEVHQDCWRNNY